MKPPKSVAFSVGGSALVLLALVAIPVRPGVAPASADPAAAPQAATPATTGGQGRDRALLAAQLARAESLPWGRDPFFRAAVSVEDPPSLEPAPSAPRARLTGISLRNGELLAIVDREIVREGEALRSGYMVTRITPRTITLRRGDHEVTLTLGDER